MFCSLMLLFLILIHKNCDYFISKYIRLFTLLIVFLIIYLLLFDNSRLYFKGDHYFTSKSGKDRRNSRKKSAAPRAPQISPSQSNNSQFNNNLGKSGSMSPGYSNNSPTFYQPPHPSNNFVNPQWNSSDGGNHRLVITIDIKLLFQQVSRFETRTL